MASFNLSNHLEGRQSINLLGPSRNTQRNTLACRVDAHRAERLYIDVHLEGNLALSGENTQHGRPSSARRTHKKSFLPLWISPELHTATHKYIFGILGIRK